MKKFLNYNFCVERNVEVGRFCPSKMLLEFALDMAEVIENKDLRSKE
jgi:hypothetical protein